MLAMARVCHRTSGRLRIKIPARKRDQGYFSSLSAHFRQLQGVEQLQVNALTGSLLFLGQPDIQEIAAYAAANQLFQIKMLYPASMALSRKVSADFHQLNKQIKRFTGGDLDLPGLAFLGLVCAGIYQISIGNFAAPAWYTAFWYATGIFQKAYSGTEEES